MSRGCRILAWMAAAAAGFAMLYWAFRGYLSPGMLFDFANLISCS